MTAEPRGKSSGVGGGGDGIERADTTTDTD